MEIIIQIIIIIFTEQEDWKKRAILRMVGAGCPRQAVGWPRSLVTPLTPVLSRLPGEGGLACSCLGGAWDLLLEPCLVWGPKACTSYPEQNELNAKL